MKKIKNIIVCSTILLAMFSCDDPLKEIMYSELTEELAYKDKNDAIASVNSIYEPLISVTNRDIFYLNDIASDAAYRKNENCELLTFNKLNESEDVIGSWEGYYKIISRANITIENVGKMDVEKFLEYEKKLTDQTKNEAEKLKVRLLGEAHFLRAWAYYQLTDIFYKVPLNLTFKEKIENIPLSSIDDVDKQIIKDFKIAASSLPKKYKSINDAGRATVGATYGMLCRVYMRKAGRERLKNQNASEWWNKALQYCNKVLNMEKEGIYQLQGKIWDVFDPTTDATKYNNELIFAVRSNPNSSFGTSDIGLNFTPWSYDMGWDLINLPLSLVWKMDIVNDQRFTKLIVSDYNNLYEPKRKKYVMPKKIEEVGTIYTEIPNPAYPLSPDIIYELEYVCTKKYMYLGAGTYNYNTGNNMPILRLADMILCKAEILNELNGPSQNAIDLINRIRERAFQNNSSNLKLTDYTTKSDLRNAICDERLLELHCEGVRRPDLIRMGLWKDRMDKYINTIKEKTKWEEINMGKRKDISDPDNAPHIFDYSYKWKVYPQDLTENDKRRYFPIPKKETDLNPDYLLNTDF